MHTLHLTSVDREKPINAIKGIRSALKEAGLPGDLRASKEKHDEFIETNRPVLLVENDEREVIDRAAVKLITDSGAAAKGQIDLSAEEAQEEVEDERLDFEQAVWQTALVLMAAADGNPIAAQVWAAKLENATGDDLYRAVISSIGYTFGGEILLSMMKDSELSE